MILKEIYSALAKIGSLSFKVIVQGEEAYTINGSRCDECGRCVQVCPQGAVQLSKTM